MIQPRIIFRDGFVCESGSTKIAVATGAFSIRRTRSLDHVSDGLEFEVPWNAAYLADVGLRSVVHYTDPLGNVSEYRIGNNNDGISEGGRNTPVRIRCVPPILDLTDCGPLTTFDDADLGGSSGYPSFHVGGIGLTVDQHISTFILPWLASRGIDWIGIGTIDFDSRYDISGEKWTPLQYLQALVEQTHGELDFRRNGDSGYLIDIVEQRNSSMSQVLIRTDRNLRSLSRERRVDPLRTVIIPTGKTPDGTPDAATIAFAAWEVTAKAGNDLTLADPVDSVGPIAYGDQFNGLYVLTPEATLVEITDTVEASQQITVADASDIAVGDHIEIRKDANGAQLTELTNPSAVERFGRVVGTVDASEMRGERNHVPNGLLNDWTLSGGVLYAGTSSGAHSAVTTLNLAGLPVGLEITTDHYVGSIIGNLYATAANKVVVGGIVSGAGTVTITVTSAVTAADGAAVYIREQPSLPDGWTAEPSTSVPFVFNFVDPSLQATLTGACNGVSASGQNRLTVDGLPPFAEIQPGYIAEVAGDRYQILAHAQADGTGAAALTTVRILSPATADDAPVTIYPPTFTDHGQNAIWMPIRNSAGWVMSPPFRVWANENTPPVWCHSRITYRTDDAAVITAAGPPSAPKMEIINADTSAIIATITEPDLELDALGQFGAIMRQEIQITEPTNIALKIYGIGGDATTSTVRRPWIYIHGGMITVGFDPSVPFVHGSHANKIHHFGTGKLREVSEEPLALSASIAHLAALNPDLEDEILDVGQSVRVMCSGMAGNTSIDRVVRLTQITFDDLNPLHTQLTMASVSPRVTKTLARSRSNARQYVQINIGTAEDADIRTVPTSGGSTSTPGSTPTDIPDAPRGYVPPGKRATDIGTGPVPIERYTTRSKGT